MTNEEMLSEEITSVRRQLIEAAGQVRRASERVIQEAASWRRPNSLGEIQGLASILDAHCGALSALMELETLFNLSKKGEKK